jgi:MFS family permease
VSLPAGALADRFDKRKLMIGTQTVLALFALALAVLYWTHVLTIYHVLVISCLSGFAATMNGPIAQSLVPDLVGRKNVLNAIALNNTMFNSARIIGPAIAGVLLGTIGAGGCFGLNSASYLAIIGALWVIRLPPHAPHGPLESVWQQILTGLRFVRGHRDIRTLVILTAVFSSFGMIYLPLMPVFARDVFHSGAREYGVMMTCVGIGAVIGGLALATVSKTRHKGGILIVGTAGIRPGRPPGPAADRADRLLPDVNHVAHEHADSDSRPGARPRPGSERLHARVQRDVPDRLPARRGDCATVRRTRRHIGGRMRRAGQSCCGLSLRAVGPETVVIK